MAPKRKIPPTKRQKKTDTVDWVEALGSSPDSSPSEAQPTEPQPDEHPDFGIEFVDPDHRDRLQRLKLRKLIPSRFIDQGLIRELGIESNVRNFAERVGLWDFLSTPVKTYQALTLEFLSTFKYNRQTDSVYFILQGQPNEYNLDELNALLGFPEEPAENPNQEFMARFPNYGPFFRDENNFQEAIFGAPPQKEKKANQISHPALRYIQRVLSRTIFGRGETIGTLIKSETFVLFCMLHRNNQERNLQPHLAHFLVQRVLQVLAVSGTTGQISIGGMVTKIANALNVDLSNQVEVPGAITIDLPYLIHASLIEKKRAGSYFHVTKDHSKIPLPVPPMDVLDRRTWVVGNQPDEAAQEQPAAGTAPTAPAAATSAPAATIPSLEGVYSMQLIYEQLLQMNTSINARFDQMNTRFDALQAEHVQIQVQQANMQAEHAAFREEFEEVAEQSWYGYHVNMRVNDTNIEDGTFPAEPIPPRPRRRNREQGGSSSRPPAP